MDRNDQLMSPESGLTLVLENDAQHKWLSERDGITPTVGDWLVRDDKLKLSLVVDAKTFSALFRGPRR
jgi:hypothetical protein